ncbi:hypothetical protein BX616_001593 [Lobosporangium transversale]|uniref:Extracellular membrane protein CFEM domain-containing protein n=1 Tax=Lobosporangium transversale TaxID=64571 RepID=A0A1Y2GT84_9FUNG|nr:hypothetical protein BCR41DRAFT_349496 [Lobosporangium transversale]KAF9903547.1 hypothetical protein BX616_001593 [Lobosporangium transversale]ORZ22700.1 hypothetical protein BCR41DRAFT_349496 [Lobosporangium transversale]|eukprot:XP_021883254.1 hypothetical protein BCR41DRAFT_349496 [Lobosporangium transversale]
MTRSLRILFIIVPLILVVLSTTDRVSAQFDISIPCNDCLEKQIVTLPSCAGVNLSNLSDYSNPQYRTCLCESTFDYSWLQPCSTSCQPKELTDFQTNFPELIKTTFNLTCVKPTPSSSSSPSPSPTSSLAPNSAVGHQLRWGWGNLDSKMILGWIIVLISSTALTMVSSL